LAQVHRRLGDHEAADKDLAQVQSLPPDEAWSDPLREQLESYRTTKGAYLARINELGRTAQREKRAAQHEKLGRTIAEALGRYPELAHLVAGRERLNRGDAQGAEVELREAARLDPRSVDAFLSLGEALMKQDKLQEAEEAFRSAVEVDPTGGLAHLSLGQCLAAQGKEEAAIAPLRSAAHYMPLSPDAHRALADALEKNGRQNDAENHRRHAKRLESQKVE
jgi:tetratricopeptide (TPR) repeat protein